MQKKQRKRKHYETRNKGSGGSEEPYPNHSRPTPEECRCVRDSLLNLHGFPQQFIKYRDIRLASASSDSSKESVLDGLINILLSQNTTDANSTKAFASLKSAFPNWEHVLSAESKCIEDAIKCGGLAVTKTSCIKNLLKGLLEKKGKLCLEYLRDMSVDEVKAELSGFKGVGPKTVACVLMFYLQQDDFPVDTHVFRITKMMGWIPDGSDREKAYLHLNKRIPDELKFDLNCLFVTHGKLCQRCSKKWSDQQNQQSLAHPCPLSIYHGTTEKETDKQQSSSLITF